MYLDSDIYYKINNHILLDKNDIKKIIYINSRGKIKGEFRDIKEDVSYYDFPKNSIVVNEKIRNNELKYFMDESHETFKKSSERRHFIVDLCNLDLLSIIFHELRHYEQASIKSFDSLKPRESIIRECYKFMDYNPKFYNQNHDLYYHEYDALIGAFKDTLSVAERCNSLNLDSIIEYNRIISYVILHSYGMKYEHDEVSKIYDKFTSPISYFKFILRFPNNPNKKKFLYSCVEYLESQSQTQYLKILNGFDISDDTLSLLYSCANASFKTSNILDEVKKREKTIIKKNLL